MKDFERHQILIATHNPGKAREFVDLFSNLPVDLRQLSEFSDITEVEETGNTFNANAELKAVGYTRQVKLWTVAEDSGLEVAALNGAPGVLSARHAGEFATPLERNEKVLHELQENVDRTARFVCVMVFASPTGEVLHRVEGTCNGNIASEPRGTNGFGYDSIFIPEGFTNTFGELPITVKQGISHRARASTEMKEFLSRFLPPATNEPSE